MDFNQCLPGLDAAIPLFQFGMDAPEDQQDLQMCSLMGLDLVQLRQCRLSITQPEPAFGCRQQEVVGRLQSFEQLSHRTSDDVLVVLPGGLARQVGVLSEPG